VKFISFTVFQLLFNAVVLKVGRTALLGAILKYKVASKAMGTIGRQNNTKGARMLNH